MHVLYVSSLNSLYRKFLARLSDVGQVSLRAGPAVSGGRPDLLG